MMRSLPPFAAMLIASPTAPIGSARIRCCHGTVASSKKRWRWPFALLLCPGLVAAATATLAAPPAVPEAQAILAAADRSRGSGVPGIEMQVRVSTEKKGVPDPDTEVTLSVKSREGSTFAEVLEPRRTKGMRLLLVERNMWLHKPGMRKPVAVSARQRLSGQAALGDIASTGYARDYNATYLRAEDLHGEPCHVLELRSVQRNTTYDRITYWVSQRSGLGLRAEFLSLAGKRLKDADFQYQNTLAYSGHGSLPFVSRMTISDALTHEQTTLDYSDARVHAFAAMDFDVGALQ